MIHGQGNQIGIARADMTKLNGTGVQVLITAQYPFGRPGGTGGIDNSGGIMSTNFQGWKLGARGLAQYGGGSLFKAGVIESFITLDDQRLQLSSIYVMQSFDQSAIGHHSGGCAVL